MPSIILQEDTYSELYRQFNYVMSQHTMTVRILGEVSIEVACTCHGWYRKISKKSVTQYLNIALREFACHISTLDKFK